jgi:hypothetical protein
MMFNAEESHILVTILIGNVPVSAGDVPEAAGSHTNPADNCW